MKFVPQIELDKQADFMQALDWSGKPIAVHTHINQFYRTFVWQSRTEDEGLRTLRSSHAITS